MKVLLTGGTGQLGRALIASCARSTTLIAPPRDALDLNDPKSIERTLREVAPDAVVNAGAYTAVDKAESERELAFAINATAAGILAEGCAARSARLIQLSTDFVFDGASGSPYTTDAIPNPTSVYGASKLQGEARVRAVAGLDWRILRTAWVYAAEGRNFVLTMLRLFRERGVVNVVSDQVGSPTSATSLASAVWRTLASDGASGVLHYTDAGVASWYDFAVAIYEEARALGLVTRDVRINPIATEQYPTPARRPAYSVLDKRSSLERLQIEPVHWRTELRKVMAEVRA